MEFDDEEDVDMSIAIVYTGSTEYSFNPCTTITERRVLCERMGGLSAQKVKYCWKVIGHKITETLVTRKV